MLHLPAIPLVSKGVAALNYTRSFFIISSVATWSHTYKFTNRASKPVVDFDLLPFTAPPKFVALVVDKAELDPGGQVEEEEAYVVDQDGYLRTQSDTSTWAEEWTPEERYDYYLARHGLTRLHPLFYYGPHYYTFCKQLDPLGFLDLLHMEMIQLNSSIQDAFVETLNPYVFVDMIDQVNRLLRHPTKGPKFVYQSILYHFPIIFDTGASVTLTPCRNDFIEFTPTTQPHGLKQLTSSVQVAGVGTVRWTLNDAFGNETVVTTAALYVPEAEVRLLSPQSWFREQKAGRMLFEWNQVIVEPPNSTARLYYSYNEHNHLPLVEEITLGSKVSQYLELDFENLLSNVTLLDERNANLAAEQKELLLWHQKLGHAAFDWIIDLLRTSRHNGEPTLLSRNANVINLSKTLCAACEMASASKKGADTSASVRDPSKIGVMKEEDLKPGQTVSMDQYICKDLGRLATTFGRESEGAKYHGGTIFVDHASGTVFIQNQVSLQAGETVLAKRAFERFAGEHGVKVLSYRSDNGVFKSNVFTEHCRKLGQPQDFSGVGAHHQNGIAERNIRTVVRWARAMMIHAALHWPETQEKMLELWPFALNHAVFLWNNMPSKGRQYSPLELFADAFNDSTFLRHAHVWGCPVFVLDPRLQDGLKVPKWAKRSRQGQYLGKSTLHATNVGLVKNLRTGSISPQFHCVYDDRFETVVTGDDNKAIDPTRWNELCQTGLEYLLDEDMAMEEIPPLAEEWADRSALEQERVAAEERKRLQQRNSQVTTELNAQRDGLRRQQEIDVHAEHESDDDQTTSSTDTPIHANKSRRSSRQRKQTQRLIAEVNNATYFTTRKVTQGSLNQLFLNGLDWHSLLAMSSSVDMNAFAALMDLETDPLTNEVAELDPRALATMANAADHPKWDEAMSGPHAEGFWAACLQEIAVLKDKDVWDEVDREDWMHVLKSVWAFRCKRYPDGLLKKLKARFCACGYDQIEGLDYFDTYAPVAQWTTIRLLLILSIELNLATVQVDYETAFVHSPVEEDIYVEMPLGFQKKNKVLKLKKSLYGIKQAPRNWFNHLKGKLLQCGFKQSPNDACLFIHANMICVIYVDDCIFAGPCVEDIHAMLDLLRTKELTITVESDMAGYLGVDIHHHEDGSIELLQTGLIDRIIEALHLNDSGYVKRTPAAFGALPKDADGELPEALFSYRSVVGLVAYLSRHSRPEIEYAASSCARFVHNPRRIHEEALIRIGLYLKGTRTRGLIIKPNGTMDVDMYCDSDFAGLWGYEEKTDPSCVKSRGGYTIFVGGCPVLWGSKLIDQIALSTMEAEYYAMSYAMKQLIPLLDLFEELYVAVGLTEPKERRLHTTVFEDNSACLILASMELPRTTPRSKHYATKYHWFRAKLKDYKIMLKPCSTDLMVADIMTKGLRKARFEALRKLLMGW